MDLESITEIWEKTLLYYSVLDHFIWGFVFWLIYRVLKLKKKDKTFEEKMEELFLKVEQLEVKYPHRRHDDDYSGDDGED